MKPSLVAFFLSILVAHTADSPLVYVRGVGDKSYSASELVTIARDDAKQKKVEFNFEGSGATILVHTDGSNIIARVLFTTGKLGSRAYCADINRSGKVATNFVGY